mmetsp:Transcript_16969/g.49148  ORF Transcript_16969/g.49148 Transcript_16969/m.49148 type:complete len:343 (-) Transcript_16969:8-1036(-)
MADHSTSLRALKLRKDAEERERVRQQLQEDRENRARRFGARCGPAEPGAHAMAAAAPPRPAALGPGDAVTADVRIRMPDGSSRRHAFPAHATLEEVRDWVRAAPPEVTPDPAARGLGGAAGGGPAFAGGTQSLVPNELARSGREHFERQTERMREEARRLRAGAAEATTAAANGGDAAEAAAGVGVGEPLYFFVPATRAEFATEDALRATTLTAAGLVPQGTLLVRRAQSEASQRSGGGAFRPPRRADGDAGPMDARGAQRGAMPMALRGLLGGSGDDDDDDDDVVDGDSDGDDDGGDGGGGAGAGGGAGGAAFRGFLGGGSEEEEDDDGGESMRDGGELCL